MRPLRVSGGAQQLALHNTLFRTEPGGPKRWCLRSRLDADTRVQR